MENSVGYCLQTWIVPYDNRAPGYKIGTKSAIGQGVRRDRP